MGGTIEQSFVKELKKGESAKLLALDGGGVKGISSLLILQAIMDAVKKEEQKQGVDSSDEERRPRDYFHLAAGTSTGGLIALMLFRLGMKTSDAIKEYRSLASKVFEPKIWKFSLHWRGPFGPVGYWLGNGWLKFKATFLSSRFSDQPLKDAIDHVVGDYGRNEDKDGKGNADLLNEKAGRMFMCTTLKDKGESILLRSYKIPEDAIPATFPSTDGAKEALKDELGKMSISVAACATSAAPTYLPEVKYETPLLLFRFWDGGLLNNNPIDQLWRARYDLVKPDEPAPPVSSVVSLGTSWSTATSWSPFRFINTVTTAASFITNTESKHMDFKRFINRVKSRPGSAKDIEYFRFNAPTNNEAFNLDDYRKMSRLEDITTEWLEKEVDEEITNCGVSLAKKRDELRSDELRRQVKVRS
ncbi:hypothetical protein V500_02617 [Pseudogymnoascus sp. VKM F-4518 (FW-2643)]|nr:hypothetical protein V500_02617 [Pseudogymnoascus sp. VKM F-4518 (FW-2643)]